MASTSPAHKIFPFFPPTLFPSPSLQSYPTLPSSTLQLPSYPLPSPSHPQYRTQLVGWHRIGPLRIAMTSTWYPILSRAVDEGRGIAKEGGGSWLAVVMMVKR